MKNSLLPILEHVRSNPPVSGQPLTEHGLHLPTMEKSPLADKTAAEISVTYAEQLEAGDYGLCFSADTEGQGAGDPLTEARVRRCLDLIAPQTRWVRSFSSTERHELIPRRAARKGWRPWSAPGSATTGTATNVRSPGS